MLRCSILLLSIAFLSPAAVYAVDDDQIGAIRGLGQLNGVALPCGYLEQTQRMKRELVRLLPKRRQLGELFDSETHQAFLHFVEQGSGCPGQADFERDVDRAVERLEAAFAAE